MSRSFKKAKVFPMTCATSEKQDKRFHNRKMRRRVHQQIDKEDFDIFPVDNEISNVWSWAKDGKGWWNGATKKDMRK